MKPILKLIVLILFAGVLFHISCKKEHSCENCLAANQTPIAHASNDTNLVLPVDSIILDGSKSSDPDDGIAGYEWKKISGPDTFNIFNNASAKTSVNKLVKATYRFELTVTDKGGLSAKDTMQVIVYAAGTTNRPPVANAGTDTSIFLPVNAVMLDGSGSTDPDNNIASYLWAKISGPTASNINYATAAQAQVPNLVEGLYQFELKVTDAGGLSSKDTVLVIVNPTVHNECGFSQTTIGRLSIPREGLLIQTVGNKIVFAGGHVASTPSSRVDIYDRSNQSWSTAELSIARMAMGVITSGGKIYFAGGYYNNGKYSSRVDIYDALNNTWSISELSEARSSVIAVAAGNKVLFAGGYNNGTKVDIYDQSNNSWSVANLSMPNTATAFTGYHSFLQSGYISSGSKIYFTGNNISTGSKNVDVYDALSNTWSTHLIGPNQFAGAMVVPLGNKIFFSGSLVGSTATDYNYANTLEIYNISTDNWSSVKMSQSRAYMAAISGDGKIFWAGGFDSSWVVSTEQLIRPVKNIEIYDVNTGLHSFHNLQLPDGWFVKALKTESKIFFSDGSNTEIYDMNSHTWTRCAMFLYQALPIGNTIYQVGADDSRVWKVDF